MNTTGDRSGERTRERMGSYRDLLTWSRRVGLIEPQDERALAGHSKTRAVEASHILGQALRIRELLYRILVSAVDRSRPAERDIEELNRLVVVSSTRRRLEAHRDGGLAWTWDSGSTRLDRMLWPVVHSAAELLASADIERLRRCGECDWLFLDGTRNRTRLWCKKACGDRVKARRYYARHRRSGSGS
jgi:predicted RNA-binding Zn ribbon-like protein